MIITLQATSKQNAFAIAFESGKYGLEYEELAGNQIEIIGDETKIGYVLERFPAKVIHKENFKYF